VEEGGGPRFPPRGSAPSQGENPEPEIYLFTVAQCVHYPQAGAVEEGGGPGSPPRGSAPSQGEIPEPSRVPGPSGCQVRERKCLAKYFVVPEHFDEINLSGRNAKVVLTKYQLINLG
jgi:hypothetical protein